jgi:hypothetical protein
MIPLSGGNTLADISPCRFHHMIHTEPSSDNVGGLYLIIRLPLGSFRACLGSCVLLRVCQLQPHCKEMKIFQLYVGKCPFIRRIIPSVAREIFLLTPTTFLRIPSVRRYETGLHCTCECVHKQWQYKFGNVSHSVSILYTRYLALPVTCIMVRFCSIWAVCAVKDLQCNYQLVLIEIFIVYNVYEVANISANFREKF